MAFRHPKSDRHLRKRVWQKFLHRHQRTLKACGVAPCVLLSEAHWFDFLENGHLHFHPDDADGFHVGELSIEQMRALLTVLNASPEYDGCSVASIIRYHLANPAKHRP